MKKRRNKQSEENNVYSVSQNFSSIFPFSDKHPLYLLLSILTHHNPTKCDQFVWVALQGCISNIVTHFHYFMLIHVFMFAALDYYLDLDGVLKSNFALLGVTIFCGDGIHSKFIKMLLNKRNEFNSKYSFDLPSG